MRLRRNEFEGLINLGMKLEKVGSLPGMAVIHGAACLEDEVKAVLEGGQLPAVHWTWSGFQFVSVPADVVADLKEAGWAPWTICSMGTVGIRASLFENPGDHVLGMEDLGLISVLLEAILVNEDGKEHDDSQAIFTFEPEPLSVDVKGAAYMFRLIKIVSEKEWQEAYQHKTLDITAGMLQYKAIKGITEPLGEQDISPERTLN